MKKERLKVLEMVESGKISVDEAAKLLDALKLSEPEATIFMEYDEAEEKLNKFSQSVDSFAKDFSDKMGSAFKGMEPKLKVATKTVLERTVSVIDDIAKSLNESLKNMEENASCCCKEGESCCEESEAPCCEESKDCESSDEKSDDCSCADNGPRPEAEKSAE